MSDIFSELEMQIRDAAGALKPAPALRAVLEAAMGRRDEVAQAIAATTEDEVLLFEDEICSIWSCRYDADVVLPPHEHRMTVHIAVFRGVEVEVLYQRRPSGLVHAKNRTVSAGEILSLGPDAVHAVTAEGESQSHAVHVYQGPLTKVKRSLFDWTSGGEVEFTMENFHAMLRRKADMAEFTA